MSVFRDRQAGRGSYLALAVFAAAYLAALALVLAPGLIGGTP
ncbi:MAG: hypothetical protein U1E58_01115 [Tabrizicola sp.]